MIETVRTKKRFIKLVIDMEYPVLYIGLNESIMASIYFLVKDRENNDKRFYLRGCRVPSNCTRKQLDDFEKRESLLTAKYQNWLYDICGDYCETKRYSEG